jgi:rifampicin phosphotransferase
MAYLIPLDTIRPEDTPNVGGKAVSLARLSGFGYPVPDTLVIPVQVYQDYIARTGIRERILLELNRKEMGEMRWEEIWDASLRIRNMFLSVELPKDMDAPIRKILSAQFAEVPVVVRSSAPMEDSARASFAGRHESYVNVAGIDAIIVAVRKVWASLWSDAAILYRNELGLSAEKSAMAVVVQEMIVGETSGVAFSRNPADPDAMMVEAVYGLNQGLVDGEIEPDRWTVDRRTSVISGHQASPRDRMMIPENNDVKTLPVSPSSRSTPPLSETQVLDICAMLLDVEQRFSTPVDAEWTFRGNTLTLLQARPITTTRGSDSEDDQRQWYLSLHRSFENLKKLQTLIEETLIPEMVRLDRQMAGIDLSQLSHAELAAIIEERADLNDKWVKIYWDEFIPYAHGVRLFGQVYNDSVRPENPYEFIDLLTHTPMTSLKRNQDLETIAAGIRSDPALTHLFEQQPYQYDALPDGPVKKAVDRFVSEYGDLSCPVTGARECTQGSEAILRLAWEMAAHPPAIPLRKDTQTLETAFLDSFSSEKKAWAADLLDLARSSYRLRDDDNIHLGRIEAHFTGALNLGIQAISSLPEETSAEPETMRLKEIVQGFSAGAGQTSSESESPMTPVRPRQIVGQPAGPGIAQGPARIIQNHHQLGEVRHGEILVCDAIDPNMTFVVPLAAAIVERRGGMLIHGAIIAREYGIPCVTGVPQATNRLKTGQRLTVDGYLGIVTVND